jgi:hypothetical protein
MQCFIYFVWILFLGVGTTFTWGCCQCFGGVCRLHIHGDCDGVIITFGMPCWTELSVCVRLVVNAAGTTCCLEGPFIMVLVNFLVRNGNTWWNFEVHSYSCKGSLWILCLSFHASWINFKNFQRDDTLYSTLLFPVSRLQEIIKYCTKCHLVGTFLKMAVYEFLFM